MAEEDAAAAETSDAAPDKEETIAQLRRDLEDEKRSREAAEDRARKHENVAAAATDEVAKSELQVVSTAIDAIKTQRAGLRAAYAEAASQNDYARAAEINDEIADAAAKQAQLEAGKAAMEEEAKRPSRRAPSQSDIVESFASQLTPKSAAWVRAHPEYVTDGVKNRRMIRAHEDAIDEGLKHDTPEYFEFVEKKLKITGAQAARVEEDADALSAAAAAKKGRSGDDAAPPAAPPARGGDSRRTVRLSPEQQEAARASGLTDEEYANNMKALKTEGRIH